MSTLPRDEETVVDSWRLELPEPISYWGLEYRFDSAILAKAYVSWHVEYVLAKVEVEGETILPCSRCLVPVRFAIHESFDYLFSSRLPAEARQEGEGDGNEEVLPLNPWEDTLDLAPQVWEVLIMSLPAAVLCREDCKGLCPQCGANLNEGDCACHLSMEDPRLNKIKDYLLGLNRGEGKERV